MLDLTSHAAARLILDRGILSAEQLTHAFNLHLERPTLSLTDTLLMFGFLSYGALQEMVPELHPDLRLGKLLVRMRTITPEQLDAAMAIQERDGGLLALILLTHGWCDRQAIVRAKTRLEDELRRPFAWQQAVGRLVARHAI